METLQAIMKSYQNNWLPGKVLNPVSLTYDEVLTTLPRYSALKCFEEKEIHVPSFLSVFQNVMYDSTHSNVMSWDNTDLAYTLFINFNTVSLCRLWEMINDYKGSRFISECQREQFICRQFVKATVHWAWNLKGII